MKRIIFIGDIHGHLPELLKLLDISGYNKSNDRLILLGDLVDRGDYSVEVVKWVRDNKIECIRGNHDQRYIDIKYKDLWHKKNPQNVKPVVLKNEMKMEIYRALSEDDLLWIEGLPTFLRIPELKTIAVHAGIRPGFTPENTSDNTLMHIRFMYDNDKPAFLDKERGFVAPQGSYFWADRYEHDWNVVYGHHVWSKTEIKVHENLVGARCYGIDTGVCFGGKLTALAFNVPDNNNPTIFQVDNLRP